MSAPISWQNIVAWLARTSNAPNRKSRTRLNFEPLEDRTVPATAIGLNFTGGTDNTSAPPDTDGAIGPSDYTQFINGTFAVYNSSTGSPRLTETDTAFWNAAGIISTVTDQGLSDTRVIYDPLTDRWFATEINTAATGNQVLVGRSNTNDPAGGWKAVNFLGDSGFADYPTLGIDANALVVGTVNFTGGQSFKGTSVFTIPKADLLLATPTAANRSLLTQVSGSPAVGFVVQGVTNFAASPAHTSLVAVHSTLHNEVNLTTVTGTGAAVATFNTTHSLTVGSSTDPGSSRQPDGTRQLDGDDNRFAGMVYQVGDLIYAVHGLSVNSAGVAATSSATTTNAIRVTVLRDSTGTVVTEGTYSNPNFDYSYPSIAVNQYGNIIIGFSRSSAAAGSGATNGNAGAYAIEAKIDPNNPSGGITFLGPDIQIKAGQVNDYHLFSGPGERWGDFSATNIDPNNPLAFWTTQEFAVAADTWGTQIGQIFVSPQVTGVSSTATNGTYGTGAVIPITVTFNHAVNVTGTPRITLNSGATVDYSSGSGTNTLTFNYTVVAGQTSPDLDYTSTTALSLNGGTINDSTSNLAAILTLATPGTTGSLGNAKALVIDATAPTVNIGAPSASTTAGGPITFTVTYSSASFGASTLTPADVTLNTTLTATGTVSVDAGTGSTRTVTISGITGDGTIGISLSANTAHDTSNNQAPAAGPSAAFTVDNTLPTVTGVTSNTPDGSYGIGSVISIQVNFSEAVIVTGSPTLALNSGGTATFASGSGTSTLTFTYTVAAGQNSVDLDYASTSALALNGGTIKDPASNNATLTLATPGTTGSLGNAKALVIDGTVPTVTSVTSSTPDGSYGVGSVISIQVNFSEPVNVTGSPTLTLNTGGTATFASGSGTSTLTFTYTVAAGQNSADLDYSNTTALSGGTIKDPANNNATLTLATPGALGSLANASALVIDGTVPTVTGVTSSTPDGSYGVGSVISIQVNFSEVVNVTGSPTLALNSGGTATFTSGSGTSTLTFTYTVAAGQNSADLDYASTSALALNGGTIKDAVGNNATLTLAALGATGSLGNAKAQVIDTTTPTVTSVTSSTPDGSYGVGSVISIQVNFSEAVNVTGSPTLALNSGGTATFTSGSGTSTLTFTYTVAATENSADLDYTSTTALSGGTIQDAVGNNATLTLAAPGATGSLGNAKALLVDTQGPTSSVIPLPPTVAGPITVSWSGQDGAGGSGIAFFDIFVSDNGGVYTLWQTHTTATSATFNGTVSHPYDFRSVATDNVGNVESSAGTSQAHTQELPLAPVFTSAAATTFYANQANTFPFTTNSTPLATYSVIGTLPAGVTFTDLGNGSATLSGTPAPSVGTFIVTVSADNGFNPPVIQTFTLTVLNRPSIAITTNTPFAAGSGTSGKITVTTTPGVPSKTTLTESGKLPTGVRFTATTGVFSGIPAVGTAGAYPITITAKNTSSSVVKTFTLQVGGPPAAPTITSTTKATFVVGQTGTFTISGKGFPFATYSSTTLPAGLTLTDNGDGTATLGGVPQAGTGGVYPITITAHNTSGPDAHQLFTLTVAQAPTAITITTNTPFAAGSGISGKITVTSTPGVPSNTTYTVTGKLPTGVRFNATTGVFSGIPAVGTAGAYPITITAKNGAASSVKTFTLQVTGPTAPPIFTSLTKATFVVGQVGTFTIAAKGIPFAAYDPVVLPAGLTFTDNGDGTATISGIPQVGTSGSHLITITANNGTVVTQLLTLTVNQPPAFLSLPSASFTLGLSSPFLISTSGFPVATLTESGPLPSGVTFVKHTDGTAMLAGIPTVPGVYQFTITASDGILPIAIQLFTLTVS